MIQCLTIVFDNNLLNLFYTELYNNEKENCTIDERKGKSKNNAIEVSLMFCS